MKTELNLAWVLFRSKGLVFELEAEPWELNGGWVRWIICLIFSYINRTLIFSYINRTCLVALWSKAGDFNKRTKNNYLDI